MKRRLALVVLMVVAIAVGWRWWAPSSTVQTVPVTARPLVFTVEIEGVLEAVTSTTLGPPPVADLWDFKIAFLAAEGKGVAAGEPVLGFETTELQRRLAEAASQRDRARAELERKRTDLEINQRRIELRLAEAQARLRRAELALAVPPELVGRRELDVARVDHNLAGREIAAITEELASQRRASAAERASLEAQQVREGDRMARLEQEIASMTVRAPTAGTVVYASDGRREKPKVGDSTWRGGKVLEIPDLSAMLVRAEVDESNLGRVEVGQQVRLHLDAHRDLEIAGTVAQIRRSVQARSPREPRRVARLRVDLATNRDQMRPGMRVRGEVEVERTAPTPSLPLLAVRPTADGPTVVVASWRGERTVAVELGRRDDQRVELLGGLEVGDRVVLPAAEVVEEP